jgi:hypothetical protein
MSQDVQAPAQAPVPPKVPLIIQYQQQLASFKQQRDIAKVNLEQLNGAIFACEHMIKQYEESAKQTLIDPALEAGKLENPLTPNENLGEINDGQVNDESEKQAS